MENNLVHCHNLGLGAVLLNSLKCQNLTGVTGRVFFLKPAAAVLPAKHQIYVQFECWKAPAVLCFSGRLKEMRGEMATIFSHLLERNPP